MKHGVMAVFEKWSFLLLNLTDSACLMTVQRAPLHDVSIFCSSLCPLLLALSLSTTVKSLALPPLLTPTRAYAHIDQIVLLFSRLHHSSFSLYLYARCSSFLIIFLALQRTHCSKPLFLLHWRPRSGPSTPVVSHQWWTKRKDHLPVGDVLPNPAQGTVAVFAVRACCWITFNSLSTRVPNSFPAKLLSRQLAPSMQWCMELFFVSGRTWHFILLNFMRLLTNHFLSLPRSFWTAAQPSGL